MRFQNKKAAKAFEKNRKQSRATKHGDYDYKQICKELSECRKRIYRNKK